MSASMPPPLALTEITVEIESARRDSLLSAVRRAARGEALDLLDGWDPLDIIRDEPWIDDPWSTVDAKTNDLTLWVRDECRLHVAAGRFQYALALLDRYLVLPPVFSLPAARERHSRMSDQ